MADSRLPDRVTRVEVLNDGLRHPVTLHPYGSQAGVQLCRPAAEIGEPTRRRQKQQEPQLWVTQRLPEHLLDPVGLLGARSQSLKEGVDPQPGGMASRSKRLSRTRRTARRAGRKTAAAARVAAATCQADDRPRTVPRKTLTAA